ncbi:MAG: DNA methyltransferase, partial [Nitrososphaerales archaeon]
MSEQTFEHINHAIPAKAHTRMYLMHKWWARKPHNVVAEYIRCYSNNGDIVLDTFCGSGVTAIEAIKLGRKAVAIDLDPIATFITRMTAMPADIDAIEKTFDKIKENVRKKIMSFYLTRCNKCKNLGLIICSIWMTKKNYPIEIRYWCPHCKDKIHKKPDKDDIARIDKINRMKITLWYPTNSFTYEDGKEFKEGTHLPDFQDIPSLFTHRNLLALSVLYDAINSITDKNIKELFKFRFTSIVHLASRMTPDRPTRPYSSFWGSAHRYWVPPKHMESNVWSLFRSAIKGKQGLVVGKEDANNQVAYYKEAKDFKELRGEGNILISTQSALDLSNIPDNSI